MSLFDDGVDATVLGRVVTVRPGRRLFVRRIVLGRRGGDDESTTRTTAAHPPSPTFVFVHGSCATEKQFHRLVKVMKDHEGAGDNSKRGAFFPPGTTCVLYDLAGCGQSPPPPTKERDGSNQAYQPEDVGWVRWSLGSIFAKAQDGALYSNDESILDLKSILRSEHGGGSSGGGSPLFLVGHSYAANLILPLVLELSSLSDKGDGQASVPTNHAPISIAGVILMSCGIRTPGNPIPDGGNTMIRTFPVPILNCLQSPLTSGFVSAALHPDTAHTKPDVLNDLTEYCNANRMDVVQAYHSQMKWFSMPPSLSTSPISSSEPHEEPSTTPEVDVPCVDIGVPVLIVHGDQDNIIPIHVGQEMANALRSELVVVPNVSHMIMMERPEEVASHVRQFVLDESYPPPS